MLKKMKWLIIPIMSTGIFVSSISCGASINYEIGDGNDISYIKKEFGKNSNEHKKIMSTYFNATDMLASLGYYPDYASKSNDGTIYSDYLKDLIGSNNKFDKNNDKNQVVTGKGEIKITPAPKIMDGKVVDRQEIIKNNISTLLLNEWEQVDQDKFVNIVEALIYTSMADGHAIYEENFYKDNQFSSKKGLNTYEAFEMLAKGLDRAYPGHDFLNKARTIIKKVKSNVKKLADKISSKTNDKTMLIAHVKWEDNKVKITQFRTPGVYSLLYSKDKEKGLGYSFPKVKNVKNINSQSWMSIKAIDSISLIDEFQNSADEIIVLNNPQGLNKDNIKKHAKRDLSSLLTSTSKLTNIHIVNSDFWYDSIWGIYGMNKFLESYIKEFNESNNISLNKISDFANDKELKLLR